MLRSKESPSGCPPRFYQSVALSVLACFVDEEDIITDACVLFNIPELLVILENSDSEEYEVKHLYCSIICILISIAYFRMMLCWSMMLIRF